MNQDPSKMYELLEVLNVYGPPESLLEKKTEPNSKIKQIDSSSHHPNHCNGKCIDCFSVFCRKKSI